LNKKRSSEESLAETITEKSELVEEVHASENTEEPELEKKVKSDE
jgi:hypothetical protein